MKMKSLALVCVVLLAVLAGCVGAASGPTNQEHSESVDDTTYTEIAEIPDTNAVHRFEDEEAGTVCYVYSDWSGAAGAGGISCLPKSETTLGSGDF